MGTLLELKEDSFVVHADSDALQAEEIWKAWGGQTGWTPPELSTRSSSKDWTCDVLEAVAEIVKATPPERVSPDTKAEPPNSTKDIDSDVGCGVGAGLGAGDCDEDGDDEPQPASSAAPRKTAAVTEFISNLDTNPPALHAIVQPWAAPEHINPRRCRVEAGALFAVRGVRNR